MGFKEYRKGKHYNHRTCFPAIRIFHGTVISLNKPLAEFVGDNKYAILFIDREKEMAAIKPCDKSEANSYRIFMHKSGLQARITARAFLSEIGLFGTKRLTASISEDFIAFKIPTD